MFAWSTPENKQEANCCQWVVTALPTYWHSGFPPQHASQEQEGQGRDVYDSTIIWDSLCDSLCGAYVLLILTGILQIWKIKKIWGEKWACRCPRCKYLWMRRIDMDESLYDTFKQCTTRSLHHGEQMFISLSLLVCLGSTRLAVNFFCPVVAHSAN